MFFIKESILKHFKDKQIDRPKPEKDRFRKLTNKAWVPQKKPPYY